MEGRPKRYGRSEAGWLVVPLYLVGGATCSVRKVEESPGEKVPRMGDFLAVYYCDNILSAGGHS